MPRARRTTSTDPAAASRPRRLAPIQPGLTTTVAPPPVLGGITDLLGDTIGDLLQRGALDLAVAIVPNLRDMEAAQAHVAEYARNYAEASGVPEPEPLADLAGIQARIVDSARSGIGEILGRDPFVSVVDEGIALPLPELPVVTSANIETAPTPGEFLVAAFLTVVVNNTRRTRIGVSTGTQGPPRDQDVLDVDLPSMSGPEVSDDASEFALGFAVVVRPSFVLALARTLITPLSLEGEPCECGPIVLSNPRVTMASGKMTDRIDATLAGAIAATVTLVDEVRVTHGLQSSSITGRVTAPDVAVHPITARAKRLDASTWLNAVLAMIRPQQFGRMAVRGILGRLAERQLTTLPSPIAMLGARLPFGARPLPPSLDASGNPVPSTQTIVLGARHQSGTTALRADITDALRVSGLVLLRPRRAAVGINVHVRDLGDREFNATASDVEMIDPSFTWTLTGATLQSTLEGAEVRFRAGAGAVVQLQVTATGADGLAVEGDLTLDVDAFLEELAAIPTT